MNTTPRMVRCPHCAAKVRTAARPGKKVRCPECREPFRTTEAAPTSVNITCPTCKKGYRLKAPKQGAKFKCRRCGTISPVLPTSETPPPVEEKKTRSAVKASKPKPQATIDTTPDLAASIEPVPEWEPPPPPKPAPPPKITPSRPSRKSRDDDDEDEGPRISGKLVVALISLVAIGVTVGLCSFFSSMDSGPARGAVQGEVKLDGVPVEAGTIQFFNIDTKTHLALPAALIKSGKYSIPREQGPAVGMCKVVIRVPTKTGKRNPSPLSPDGDEEIVEGAAPRFNTASQLTFKIEPGSNTANFDVSAQ